MEGSLLTCCKATRCYTLRSALALHKPIATAALSKRIHICALTKGITNSQSVHCCHNLEGLHIYIPKACSCCIICNCSVATMQSILIESEHGKAWGIKLLTPLR